MTTTDRIRTVTDPADLGVLEASSLLRTRALSAVLSRRRSTFSATRKPST